MSTLEENVKILSDHFEKNAFSCHSEFNQATTHHRCNKCVTGSSRTSDFQSGPTTWHCMGTFLAYTVVRCGPCQVISMRVKLEIFYNNDCASAEDADA
jgi:hypothetical protein